MNMISLIAEHWIALSVSLVVTLGFAFRQWKYYAQNKKRISSMRSFFLSKSSDYGIYQQDEVALIQLTGLEKHPALKSLIQELDLYIQKSIGTADFNVIQNKTERYVESLYEHSTAELSFPTYYGLMGTFTGTFIGLIGFLISGSDLSDESKVTNLIIGVLVSMATSLFGLVLTTRSNHDAASAKKQLDEQKNEFLDFIQLELIPRLQTTITTLQQTMEGFVPKFDVVINKFASTFSSVIERFRDTFDECTDNFGSEFRQNSSLIATTVATLNESIGQITANVENQRLLLAELRSEKMFVTMQQFVDSAKAFRTSTAQINTYNELLQSLINTSHVVIDKQTEFAHSLEIPQELIEKVTRLLDRISNFELRINDLGENIAQSEMLGNKELALIQRHLESLEEKKQLADRFLDTSNDELEAIFKEQNKVVKSLFSHYHQQLEDERDALNNFVRETLQIISKKKADLLNHLENAFDVSRVNAMFSHLKTLPEIVSRLEEMQQIIIHDEQLSKHIQELLTHITMLQQTVSNASSSLTETLDGNTASQIQAMGEEQKKLAVIIKEASEVERSFIGIRADEMHGAIAETRTELQGVREAAVTQADRVMTGINGITAATKYLQRDIVRDVSNKVSGEVGRITMGIQESGQKAEAAIRTSSEQTLRAVGQYSAESKRELSELLKTLQHQGQLIVDILDVLKEEGE